MDYRALFLFSSALTLTLAAGCSSDDDSVTSAGGAGGKGGASSAGSAGKGAGAGGTSAQAGSGEAGEPAAEAGTAGTIEGAGAGGEAGGSDLPPLPTLDGSVPLVIGHRGLPGLHPEETVVAYDGALAAGADSLEEDLHLSKDCVLVARHNPWLSDNTTSLRLQRRMRRSWLASAPCPAWRSLSPIRSRRTAAQRRT